jgi:hypothetical protein
LQFKKFIVPADFFAETKYVDPAQCPVIGDAPCGVVAVSRAGMQAIGLLSGGITEADCAGRALSKSIVMSPIYWNSKTSLRSRNDGRNPLEIKSMQWRSIKNVFQGGRTNKWI